ncbi:MAG: hypothetical protein A3D31_05305 [Candidatus Fluviicola riflensis]|nr:MAG: hypothetical protein CHH17_09710 [Candidatus Fluviicola riflensis]OGS79387.1 MAG: hypothetical protein A3D31_05305 [Candidatus Fluviicola riflensis]OGS86819.1 MAG: hypothetical protein A2724_04765 [Fluviicola sp. RIFCSPHIGHO2_01_FULL_43_53]OGS89609.1 MAG: hypothetical protein A3E30_01510 [Fluviicola sp. RIFCSPHIGHO2_12_FULL_43_24]
MKPVILLLILLVPCVLFAQIDSTNLANDEDQILQKIQPDEPSEPIIRFGTEQINLLGKWCYAEIDSNSFVLSKIPDSIIPKNCLEISFGYWGFIGEEMNRSFSVIDSVFQFHFFTENNYFTKSYTISQYNENQLFFKYLKTDSRTISANQTTKQTSIQLTHQFKNKTADLSLDRVFRLTVDSIYYRGEVLQSDNCVIVFHAYFVDGTEKDSIYRFSLDSVSGISYYTAKHPERFFEKNRNPPSKMQEKLDDAFRVIGYIGGMSILATVISSSAGKKSDEGESDVKAGIDPVLVQIGLISGLLNFTYYSAIILHRSLITDQYDLTEEWFTY